MNRDKKKMMMYMGCFMDTVGEMWNEIGGNTSDYNAIYDLFNEMFADIFDVSVSVVDKYHYLNFTDTPKEIIEKILNECDYVG